MYHNASLFNGIWSDVAIETTFMRYGHGQSGIIGITLIPETLKTWAYSLHTCHGTIDDLNEMRYNERPSAQTSHKEKTQMESFECSWPGGFHDSIPKIVTTIALSRKHIKVEDAKVFDSQTIYARAMGLQSSARDIDTTTLMGHELSPIPTSMFDENGNMRDAKTKSNLMNALKVEVSRRISGVPQIH